MALGEKINSLLDNATLLDLDLVRAQESRRVIDRLVGYTVSPALQDLLKRRGLSAGRVQSVVLMMICLREQEIIRFVPTTHYGLKIQLENNIEATWNFQKHLPEGVKILTDEALARAVQARTKHVRAIEQEKEEKVIPPPAPLITADLLEAAAKYLKLSAKKTMAAAQTLFEDGLITYHRTDAPFIDAEFIEEIRNYAISEKLPIPETAPSHKADKNAQEAHEGIRVTNIRLRTPTDLVIESDTWLVYHYVWFRTLASQLLPARETHILQPFVSEGVNSGQVYADTFETKSVKETVPGWRLAIGLSPLTSLSPKTASSTSVSEVSPGKDYLVVDTQLEAKKTRPPQRYSEASLVKKMKSEGIGRPSTYASIIETLLSRSYIDLAGGKFQPLPLGQVVFGCLEDQFSFMAIKYTAEIESDIDLIASGKSSYIELVRKIFDGLEREIASFKQRDIQPIVTALGVDLPGENAKKKTSSIRKKPNAPNVKSGDPCKKCHQGKHTLRTFNKGKNTGKQYFGCTHFPDCRFFQWAH